MICGLCVGQVIVIIQRDPSKFEIQNNLIYIPLNIGLKLKIFTKRAAGVLRFYGYVPHLTKCLFHNKRPSGAPSDVALEIRCTVLYVENDVRFHGARVKVILFTYIRKVWAG